MSIYGKTTDENGNQLIAAKVITGLCVSKNKLISFDFAKDEQGNDIKNRAVLSFEQSNGYIFNISFFDSDLDWAIKNLNRNLLHICHTMVTLEEYNEIVKDCSDFTDFISKLRDKIFIPNYGKLFDCKIVYFQNKQSGKWYAGFPTIPPFIGADGANVNFTENPLYDFFKIPQQPTSNTEGNAATGTPDDDMPF